MQVDGKRVINPPSGTVVDDVITCPERYDFFLVSFSNTASWDEPFFGRGKFSLTRSSNTISKSIST